MKYLEASWDNTNSRVHDVKKLTVLQTSPLTISVEGKTTYQRSNGEEQKGVWTAVQTYAEENGVQKIMDYKINFVSRTTILATVFEANLLIRICSTKRLQPKSLREIFTLRLGTR